MSLDEFTARYAALFGDPAAKKQKTAGGTDVTQSGKARIDQPETPPRPRATPEPPADMDVVKSTPADGAEGADGEGTADMDVVGDTPDDEEEPVRDEVENAPSTYGLQQLEPGEGVVPVYGGLPKSNQAPEEADRDHPFYHLPAQSTVTEDNLFWMLWGGFGDAVRASVYGTYIELAIQNAKDPKGGHTPQEGGYSVDGVLRSWYAVLYSLRPTFLHLRSYPVFMDYVRDNLIVHHTEMKTTRSSRAEAPLLVYRLVAAGEALKMTPFANLKNAAVKEIYAFMGTVLPSVHALVYWAQYARAFAFSAQRIKDNVVRYVLGKELYSVARAAFERLLLDPTQMGLPGEAPGHEFKPDVIALQEVLARTLRMMLNPPEVLYPPRKRGVTYSQLITRIDTSELVAHMQKIAPATAIHTAHFADARRGGAVVKLLLAELAKLARGMYTLMTSDTIAKKDEVQDFMEPALDDISAIANVWMKQLDGRDYQKDSRFLADTTPYPVLGTYYNNAKDVDPILEEFNRAVMTSSDLMMWTYLGHIPSMEPITMWLTQGAGDDLGGPVRIAVRGNTDGVVVEYQYPM